jgi:tRNA (mo5U34)-methyltransferase
MSEWADKVKQIPYWYHRITLPDGTVTPGWAPISAEKYALPKDMTGKRVLDIGAWDGYWTWEALKRGAAEVVAIDDFSDTCGQPIKRDGWKTFDLCRTAFGFTRPHKQRLHTWKDGKQTCQRLSMSVESLVTEEDGSFDIIMCFGTLYHLKNPMLALERIQAVLKPDGQLFIESAICDDYSPYRGGLNRGYRGKHMLAEFYPSDEYGQNPSNWWVPTLPALGYMVQASGFENVELWRLTENPKQAAECRGFCWAGQGEPPEEVKKQAYTARVLSNAKITAVMSVPRLGFNDNREHVCNTLVQLRIGLRHVYGAFWGQSLEQGLQTAIDEGSELLIVIDYDTLFTKDQLQELLSLMDAHPEIDAIAPVQLKRGGGGPLCTVRSITGQRVTQVPMEDLHKDTLQIATGHFGLTIIRTSALMKMKHPWFWAQPDKDGQWGRDRTDADIYFWRKFAEAGNKAYLANRVVIGHLELMATWPDKNMQPIYQIPGDFHDNGKPRNAWS